MMLGPPGSRRFGRPAHPTSLSASLIWCWRKETSLRYVADIDVRCLNSLSFTRT